MTGVLLLRSLWIPCFAKLVSDPVPVAETVFFAWRRLVEARRQVPTSGLFQGSFHMLL